MQLKGGRNLITEPAHKAGFSYLSLLLYGVVYLLYVWKYSLPNRPFPTATLAVFGLIVPILALVGWLLLRRFGERPMPTAAYLVLVGAAAVILTVLMSRFDPAGFEIGRLVAVNDWAERLILGINPYTSPTLPSALPFWFLVALPFSLFGEPGLLQILALLGFAWAVRRRRDWWNIVPLALLVLSPLFLFEVVVRSDLLSNTVLILIYLELLRRWMMSGARETAVGGLALRAPDLRKSDLQKERKAGTSNVLQLCLWGLLGGLVAATRGIGLVALALFLPYWMRRNTTGGNVVFIVSGLVGFTAVTLPFALWDWSLFWSDTGPVAIQLSHAPLWMPVMAYAVAVVIGMRLKSAGSAYRVTALILFAVIAARMIQCLIAYGVDATIMYDERFDPAYFAFCIPFALAGMMDRDQT